MHDTAFQIGALAMDIYVDLAKASVLEIGSQAFNGSLRSRALPGTHYVGIDMEEGDGVDLVVQPAHPFPVEDGSFDFVFATSVFEHDPSFWVTFLEMCRATKDGGFIYINVPSNGVVHGYPEDNWRFYPGAGKALARWANSQGHHVTLIESFVAERQNDIWNDFVAVFRKGRITKLQPATFLHEHVPSFNVITWRAETIMRPRDETEDRILLVQASEKVAEAEGRVSELRSTVEDKTREIDELGATIQGLREQETASSARIADLEQKLAEFDAVRAALASRDSELLQRQEEIQQTRDELIRAKRAFSDSETDAERLRSRLARVDDELSATLKLMDQTEARLKGQNEQLEGLRESYDQLRNEMLTYQAEAASYRSRWDHEVPALNDRLHRAESRAEVAEGAMDERFRELGILTGLLREHEARLAELQEYVEWNDQVRTLLAHQPAWWGLMPASWRAERINRDLRAADLFDHRAYYDKYPDVEAAGFDALEHYCRHGINEGRTRTF